MRCVRICGLDVRAVGGVFILFALSIAVAEDPQDFPLDFSGEGEVLKPEEEELEYVDSDYLDDPLWASERLGTFDGGLLREGEDLDDLIDFSDVRAGFSVSLEAGVGYDTNARLNSAGDVSDWVSWFHIGAGYHSGAHKTGRGLYYGVDLGGNLISYGSGEGQAGRDNVEPSITLYAGVRGAKTDIRVDADYRMESGTSIDYSDLDREARSAERDVWNISVSAHRELPHGRLTGGLAFDDQQFAQGTGLNDTEGVVGDLAWFYDPGFAPKTSLGIGLRAGFYEAEQNFDQNFWEPSLRIVYAYSPKTTFHGRFGYNFRQFDGPGAIDENNTYAFGFGMSWRASHSTVVDVEAFRDFSPSFTSANENFNATGVRVNLSQQLPGQFVLGLKATYETADYFSTAVGGATNRDDDYWRFGVIVSHPCQVTDRITGSVSAFFHYSSNDSTIAGNEFDQIFTGVKVGLNY